MLITDNGNNALRQFDLKSNVLSTLILSKSERLFEPRGMTIDSHGNSLLLCNKVFITQYNLTFGVTNKFGGSKGFRLKILVKHSLVGLLA